MKKFKKNLAIISSITLMSCFGAMKLEAVRYNEKGVPVDLELSESPTEEQIVNELRNLVEFLGNRFDKEFNEIGEIETFKLENSFVYKKMNVQKPARDLTENELTNAKEDVRTYMPTKVYYDHIIGGGKGCCRTIASYIYTILKKSGLESTTITHPFDSEKYGITGHDVAIVKIDKRWFVLDTNRKRVIDIDVYFQELFLNVGLELNGQLYIQLGHPVADIKYPNKYVYKTILVSIFDAFHINEKIDNLFDQFVRNSKIEH